MNLYTNENWSIQPEGRFFIVTYRTMHGNQERIFDNEADAKKFAYSL